MFSKLFKNMTLMTSVIIFCLLFVVMFFILPFDMNSKQDNVTKLYYADNISPAHKVLIDRFNNKYSGKIQIIPVNLPFTKFSTNERKELLARTLRSKSDRIDLFTVDIIWVPRFAKWCQPLDSALPHEFQNQILNQVKKSCYYKNQLVSIPLYTDISLMYYRRDIIEKLADAAEVEKKLKTSITWKGFLRLQQRLSAQDISNPFYIYPGDNFEGLVCCFFEGLAGQNGSYFSGDSIRLLTPAARKSLQILVDLVNKYKMTPRVVTKFDEYQGYIYALQNDAVFVRGWPGFLKHYNYIIPSAEKLVYFERAALPHFSGGKPTFVYGGWNFMISKFSTKREAAIQFIKFALQKENQKMLFDVGDFVPINKSVYEDSLFLRKRPELVYYRKLLDLGVYRPQLVNYTRLSDVLSYYLHLAIKNEITVEEALTKASEIINSKQILVK